MLAARYGSGGKPTKERIMDKLIVNELVAVIYSPGFGAGWYTWNKELPNPERLLFDPILAQAVLDGNRDGFVKRTKEMFGEDDAPYLSGFDDLCVAFIPQGVAFRVSEYDGNERIVWYKPEDYIVA